MKKIALTIIALLFGLISYAQLAFPTAEGYGKYASGGRGGTVYEVTNLNASGTGSLGDALSAGNRTIVFRVSGTIVGNFTIRHDNTTIAGQTAPGDGICIKGNLSTAADNLIIRYIRVRNDPAVNTDGDATGGRYHKNIIYDHVSASWSTDEVFSLYHNTDVTIQWCMITEACPKIVDGVNTGHRFGGIWGNDYGTYHHNLIADNDSRNMRWASGSKYNDYRNNVLYNWGYQSCYGGGRQQQGTGLEDWNFTTINMVGNYYKPGPATQSDVARRIAAPSNDDGVGSWYVSGNYVDGYPAVTADNWLGIDGSDYVKMTAPWPAMTINQQTPQAAYDSVVAKAGCSYPKRDAIDSRIMMEVQQGVAYFGNNGIITSPSDVGGWPILKSTSPPTDTDHDGMPDAWETAHGLNPNDASDRNNVDASGYTMLEEYIDGLVDNTTNTSVPVSGVSMSPASLTLSEGAISQLVAIVQPVAASNKKVTWTSSDPTVAKVMFTGAITGVAAGTATITATTDDGSFTAQCTVTVVHIAPTGILVGPSTADITVGGSANLTATVYPSDVSNSSVTWSSSNTSVATVDQSGKVTGVAAGSAVITATTDEGSLKSSCTVTVTGTSAVDVKSEPVVQIYPTQFKNNLNINFGEELTESAKVQLLNIEGRIVKSMNEVVGNTQIDVSDLKSGLYFVRVIEQTNNIITKKVIKLN